MYNDLVANYMQTPPGTVLGGSHFMMTNIFKDAANPNSGTVVCFKDKDGSPVDTFPFDSVALYMGSTEFNKPGWSEPNTVKIFADIVLFSLRDIGLPYAGLGQYSGTRLLQFEKGILDFAANHNPCFNVGQGVCQFRGLQTINFGKDVGTREAAIVDWYWEFPQNRETYYWAKGLGLVRWQHALLKGNEYVVDQTSDFNVIGKGPVPVLNYPVGNILGTGK